MTAQYQFTDILLGPARVLRTETTALTAITALGAFWRQVEALTEKNHDQARHRDGTHRNHQHQERHQLRYVAGAQRRGYELSIIWR